MTEPRNSLKVAILGSGNIGTDLLIKVLRSHYLDCSVFLGRNLSSAGMTKALSLGVKVSADGVDYITKNPDCCDLVFDATSAKSHLIHAPILKKLNKKVINLTPAPVGFMSVPSVNMKESILEQNINMITCGGQASIPVAYAIGQTQKDIEYIEVISSISSRSAGPATRQNIDEYIGITEIALKNFSGAHRTKAILNLNPAEPCVDMQTTIFAKVNAPDLGKLDGILSGLFAKVQEYVPGYEVILGPLMENGLIVVMVRVRGLGDYLPVYAGNLDIINCAAIAIAQEYAKSNRNWLENGKRAIEASLPIGER